MVVGFCSENCDEWLHGKGFERIRTDTEYDDEDDECIHHREEGGGDCCHHLFQRVNPSEEPDDSQGSHQLDEPIRNIHRAQVDEGHEDNAYVEIIPAAVHERGEPVRVSVEAELHCEVRSEGQVQVAHYVAELSR